MKKILLLLAALLLITNAAEAKIMVIVGNKAHAATATVNTKYVNTIWSRMVEVLGLNYDTYPADYYSVSGDDTTFLENIAASGRYSMAVVLNLPVLDATMDTHAEMATNGFPRLGYWINRNSAYKFPIPLFLPLPSYMVTTTGSTLFLNTVTGQISSTQRSGDGTMGAAFEDAAGDSIYQTMTYNGLYESRVAENDTLLGGASSSFCNPLVWRSTAGHDATNGKYCIAWMTQGTGNHKVIYMTYSSQDSRAFMWPTIIGMFEKIRPIEVPVVVEMFGWVTNSAGGFGTSQDTTNLGNNLKSIKDFCVANNWKLDIGYNAYQAYTQNKAVHRLTPFAWAAAYPGLFQVTNYTWGSSWSTTAGSEWLGSSSTIYYNTMNRHISRSLDSIAVHFTSPPDTARLYGYSGYYGGYTASGVKADTVLKVLTANDVKQIYTKGTAVGGRVGPSSLIYGVVGPRRTCIQTAKNQTSGYKWLEANAFVTHARYTLQQANNDDTLRLSYIVGHGGRFDDNRADWSRLWPIYVFGYYRDKNGTIAETINSNSAGNRYSRVARNNTLAFGFALNEVAMAGDLDPGPVGIDSTKSTFMFMLEDIIEHRDISAYINATYGTVKQPIFIGSFMQDVCYDRKNGRRFANSHVNME